MRQLKLCALAILASATISALVACNPDQITRRDFDQSYAAPNLSQPISGAGCGVQLRSAGGAITLVSVNRSQLPAAVYGRGRRFGKARSAQSREMFKLVAPFELEPEASGTQATALCALPFDADSSAIALLKNALPRVLRSHRYFTVQDTSSLQEGEDLLTRALFAEELQLAGANARRHVHRPSDSEQPRLTSILGDDVQNLAAMVITASPWSNSWFFDMRQIGALWASLLTWNGDFEVLLVTYEGGPHPCTVASEAWFVLDELERNLRDLADALSGMSLPGEDFDATRVCPDSLMFVGQNCLDFYISAATAGGFLAGDNRESNPYATLAQSKVWVLDDFNNNRVSIFLSGSTVAYPISITSWPHVTVGVGYFPPDSAGQVRRLQVDSLDANTRTIELKVSNGVCPAAENWVASRFPIGQIPASIMRAVCPEIDAKIWYVRDGANWRVSHVERDAFPTLDIVRKMPDGSLQIVNSARNRAGGVLWLMGIWKMIYDVQEEKNQLLGEGCNLE